MAGECETGESAIELIPGRWCRDRVDGYSHAGNGWHRSHAANPRRTPRFDGPADVDLRRRGPSRRGRRLRRRGLPAQRTPESRSADQVMASSPLRPATAARSVPYWRVPKVLFLTAVQSSSSLGYDLIHRFTAERFQLFLTASPGHVLSVPAYCCRCGSTCRCCDPPGCWPSSRSAPRSVSCWGSRCAWRDAADISNRSRWFVSVTGPAVLLVTFIVPNLLPVMVLAALVPVVFAEPYIRWRRGLAFTAITAGCVLALAALARFRNVSHLGAQVASLDRDGIHRRSTADQCLSHPGDCVEQRRGAASVGERCSPSAPPNSRRHVAG